MSGNRFGVLPLTGRGRRMHEFFCKAIAKKKKKKKTTTAAAAAAMAVCALPASSFQICAHASNPACSTATTTNLLNSRIQSKTYFPCTTAGGGAGTSDFRLFSASRSSGNSTSSSSSSSTEKVGKNEEIIMEMSSNNLGVAVVEEGNNQLVRSVSACQGCGKEEKVGGCNGEGRIKGGLGAVPGFGWFPIKAYRPCPSFVEAGGKYRRQGQSLEEVAFGRAGKQDNLDISERLRGDKR